MIKVFSKDYTYLLINSNQSHPYLICYTQEKSFIGKDCIFKLKTTGTNMIKQKQKTKQS